MKKNRKRQYDVDPNNPKLPAGWDRCHAFLAQKGRFCRQQVSTKSPLSETEDSSLTPRYCGNHYHLYDSVEPNLANDPTISKINTAKRIRKDYIRIPCPIDPSHTIFKHMLHKHLAICPKAKQQHEMKNKPYYKLGINKGGHGRNHERSDGKGEDRSINEVKKNLVEENTVRAQNLALAILHVYSKLFPNSNNPKLNIVTKNDKNVDGAKLSQMTAADLYNAIPIVDKSADELKFSASGDGLTHCVDSYKIKTGGSRHLHQQASIIGHLRQRGLLENTTDIIEMGAGRGILGLLVAGVTSAINESSDNDVNLIMVERSVSRSKADTRIRQAQKLSYNLSPSTKSSSYFNLDKVQFHRIRCDIADIHLPTAISTLSTKHDTCRTQNHAEKIADHPKTIAIAKHLCGCGTDLALKSLLPATSKINACAFATCCHGVCDWDDYIGRSYIQDIFATHCPSTFLNNDDDRHSGKQIGNASLTSCKTLKQKNFFGKYEFDLMKKWTAGCVHSESPKQNENIVDCVNEHTKNDTFAERKQNIYSKNVSILIKSLNLSCGVQGFGRSCQRIIDYGRILYMKEKLGFMEADLLYYVDDDVTPQNSLLIAWNPEK